MTRKFADAIAVAFEIFCPNDKECGRKDPIPETGGSFMWDRLPTIVTCPDCKKDFPVKKKIVTYL